MTNFDDVNLLVDSWTEGFKQTVDNRQKEWDELHAENLFGASVVGGCARAAVYNRRRVKMSNPPNESTLGIFEMGHHVEAYFLDHFDLYLRENKIAVGIDRQAEAKFSDFVAHTDGLVRWGDDMPPTPIEVKSKDSEKFRRTLAFKNGDFEPYETHAMQISMFIHLCNITDVSVAQHGIVWYFSQDLLTQRPCVVEYKDYKNKIEERMKLLSQHWEEGTLPDRPHDDPSAVPCTYPGGNACAWKEFCWLSRVEPVATKAKLEKLGHTVARVSSGIYVVDGNVLSTEELVDLSRES